PVRIPQSSGSPLPAAVRNQMEPRLGGNLGGVRIHTASDSAVAAKDLGARAFTVGSDVHFNAGQFQPGTKEGDKLIAHELTHVVQGQKSGVHRQTEEGGEESAKDEKDGAKAEEKDQKVSQPGDPSETEADAVSEKVAGDLHAGGEAKNG